MRFDFVNRVLITIFGKLGHLIGQYPWAILVTTSLGCLAATSGIVCHLNFRAIKTFNLLVPTNARALKERADIDDLFKTNISHNFDLARITFLDRFVRVIITAKDGRSILSRDIFRQISELDKFIHNLTISISGRHLRYDDICAKKSGKCFLNDVLFLESHLKDFEEGSYMIKYPLMYDERTLKIYFFPPFLGGLQFLEEDFLRSAKAVSLYYILDFEDPAMDGRNAAWEETFLLALTSYALPNISVTHFTSESVTKESETAILKCLPHIGIGALIFCLIFSLGKPIFGVLAMIALTIEVGAAVGTSQYLNIPFPAPALIMVILAVGPAVEAASLLYSCQQQDRLSEVFKTTCPGLAMSWLGTCLALLVVSGSPYPLGGLLCLQGLFVLLWTGPLSLGLVGALLVICNRISVSGSKNVLHRIVCGQAPNTIERTFSNFFRNTVSKAIFNPSCRVTVCLCYGVYMAIAGYGLSFPQTRTDDSYVSRYWSVNNPYFANYPLRLQVVIPQQLDYSDIGVQQSLEKMLQKLEDSPNASTTESWLRQFLRFTEAIRLLLWYRGIDITKKEDFMFCLREIFLPLRGFDRFGDDIVFNDNQTDIVGSRFLVQSSALANADDAIQKVRSLRSFLDTYSFKVFAYNPIMPLVDHTIVLSSVALESILVSIASLIILIFILVPIFSLVPLCLFAVSSTLIGLLGFMKILGISLNVISLILLVISVVSSILSAAKFLRFYHESSEERSDVKIKDIFEKLNYPLTQALLASIVIAMGLFFAGSRIETSIAKMMILMSIAVYVNSVFIVPTVFLLSQSVTWSIRRVLIRRLQMYGSAINVETQPLQNLLKPS